MLFAGKVMKMLDSRILISVCIAGVAALFLAQSFLQRGLASSTSHSR